VISTERPSDAGYDSVAKIFHWLLFALLATQYTLGWLMPHIGRNTRPEGLIAWHLWVGVSLVLILIARIVWRFLHPVPLVAENTPRWQIYIARLTHGLLYLGLAVLLGLG
jgi:cytochrome b561